MKVLTGRVVFALVVAVMLLAGLGVAPGVAGAQGCPEANPTYTDACGPTFTTAPWGDAGGWTDPSQYSTIQLADVNGDGRDELIGRNDEGLEIWWFDTSVGQWRPQVDANGTPVALTDFASPAPGETSATDWTKPEYYSTIQTVHLNGSRAAQIMARFADGIRVYSFTPGPNGSINGGSWSVLSRGGPFTDANGWTDPSRYLTIRTGNLNVNDPGTTDLIGRAQNGLVGYSWNGSGWSPLPAGPDGPDPGADTFFADSNCGTPSCYGLFRVGHVHGGPFGKVQMVGRTARGVDVLTYQGGAKSGTWFMADESADAQPPARPNGLFGDQPGGPDCPFPGTTDCLGSSPSYYETLGVADFTGNGSDEIFARAPDGLRAIGLDRFGWNFLPTLTALGGAASSVQAGAWGSIRTGDILGNNRDQVLALDSNGLEAYSYQPSSQTWSQLPGSLGLTGDWLTNPAYYSTIQVGDVDGDGHADVVARGPFGIRTWFYNRRGTGGWERYLPGGYPAFPGAGATPGQDTGEAAAFDALNKLALNTGAITSGTIRGVWTTPTQSPPDTTTLSDLQTDLASQTVANCTGETRFAPPTYASCVPPTGISATDWTPVVNEVLSEAYDAEQVIDHFGDVETMRQGLFESETGSLPAIAADLQLNGAAGNPATFNLQGFFAGATGIAASIAGLAPGVGPVVSAALWVASEIISMVPSAAPAATSTFQGTYGGLLTQLGTVQDAMAKAVVTQRQQVLGDQGLLELVGQLRSAGTWRPDTDGMQSASREAFVLHTYQALLPTMYQRYAITNCTNTQLWSCDVPTGSYVIGPSDGSSATWIGPPSANPCAAYYPAGTFCNYSTIPGTIPDSVANLVWGAVSPTCNYVPGNKATLWTFGCSLGVPLASSIGADSSGWSFTTRTGAPIVFSLGSMRAASGVVRARSGSAVAGARAARAGSTARAPRDHLGPLRFSGRLFLSRGLRLSRAAVVVERTLFEYGRREELARSGSGGRLRPFALRHVRAGLFASAGRDRPSVRLNLRRMDSRGGARLDLRLARVRVRDIRALCAVLPARVSRDGRPLELETRLRLRDGNATQRITLRQRWRCVRDRKGEFVGIAPIVPRRPTARPGLGARLSPPRLVDSGRRATVRVTVANQRGRRPSRVISSLWNVRITATAGGPLHTIAFKELRARRSRSVRVTVAVPALARRVACVRVAVNADSARGVSTQRCVQIARRTPHVTG